MIGDIRIAMIEMTSRCNDAIGDIESIVLPAIAKARVAVADAAVLRERVGVEAPDDDVDELEATKQYLIQARAAADRFLLQVDRAINAKAEAERTRQIRLQEENSARIEAERAAAAEAAGATGG